jgi:hypothetical protein
MKAINSTLIAGLVGFGLLFTPTTKASTEVANLTGCLVRGDRPHQYSLTDSNGMIYGLVPYRGINMKRHIGQTVNIEGWVIKGDRERRQARDSATPVASEYLRVNRVKRVSSSCS